MKIYGPWMKIATFYGTFPIKQSFDILEHCPNVELIKFFNFLDENSSTIFKKSMLKKLKSLVVMNNAQVSLKLST